MGDAFQFWFDFFFENPIKWFFIGGIIYCFGSVFFYADGSFNYIGALLTILGAVLFYLLSGRFAHNGRKSAGICTLLILMMLSPVIMKVSAMEFRPLSEISGVLLFFIGIALLVSIGCLIYIYDLWFDCDDQALKKEESKKIK